MFFAKYYLCILGIIVFSLLPVGMAEASDELTDTQKLNYAVSSEKMYGHLAASLDVFLNGGEYSYLAKSHLGHAMIDEFETSHKFFQNYPDYYRTSMQTLTEIESIDSLDNQSFETDAKKIIKLVRTGQNMIIGEKIVHTDEFSLFITTSLLETAKKSLQDSQHTTGVSQIMFMQDAKGFVMRADMMFKNIDDMEPNQFKSITDLFEKYFLISDYPDKKDEQIKYLDRMIMGLYYYQITQNKKFSFPDEPQVIMTSKQVKLNIVGVPRDNIISFTGEGFPPNPTLDISYITSDNDSLQQLKINTTKTGAFFLPIDVNVDKKTYYVSITSQKITTNYMLQ